MTPNEKPSQPPSLWRWAPLGLIVVAMVAVFTTGLHKYVSFSTIGQNYEGLRAFIAENLVLALLAYMALYIVVVALSLPGGLIMTLTGGLLFGWVIGTPATVVAATLGATLVFLVVKTSFGEALAARAGPWLDKLRDGFQDNALSYLLFLRLVPVFPFVVVNLAPALLGVPLGTYVLGTLIGIIPGSLAFSVAGAGLGSVIEAQNQSHKACLAAAPANPETACPYTIDTSALITTELLAAFALLGIVALIPVIVKKWSARSRQSQSVTK